MKTINLSQINDKKRKILSGVDFGEEARIFFNLDSLDNSNDIVTVLIPDKILSVNSSFFSGLFQISLKKLGEAGFREKYLFDCDDIIRENIKTGILNIVNTFNFLEDSK